MRIAVLADTHNRLPSHVTEAIRGADEIWHLGDVVNENILEELRTLGPLVRIVRGNCDECLDWPIVESFTIAGHRICLEHVPSRNPPAGTDLYLHGHTHVPRDETIGGIRFLNPGCITRPNRGAPASYAWLTLAGDGRVLWELVRV
jgi:uncharacterized protein